MTIYYAGIGSRDCPDSVMKDMQRIAEYLANAGYILRSGGASGSDTAFERGARDKKEIYLPWDGFNGRKVDNQNYFLWSGMAKGIAASHHPNWKNCGGAARKLHTRNVHQILGKDLQTPSKFVICWTKDGKISGGTGQAMRIAKSLNIPIFNLKNMTMAEVGKAILELMKNEQKPKVVAAA